MGDVLTPWTTGQADAESMTGSSTDTPSEDAVQLVIYSNIPQALLVALDMGVFPDGTPGDVQHEWLTAGGHLIDMTLTVVSATRETFAVGFSRRADHVHWAAYHIALQLTDEWQRTLADMATHNGTLRKGIHPAPLVPGSFWRTVPNRLLAALRCSPTGRDLRKDISDPVGDIEGSPTTGALLEHFGEAGSAAVTSYFHDRRSIPDLTRWVNESVGRDHPEGLYSVLVSSVLRRSHTLHAEDHEGPDARFGYLLPYVRLEMDALETIPGTRRLGRRWAAEENAILVGRLLVGRTSEAVGAELHISGSHVRGRVSALRALPLVSRYLPARGHPSLYLM